MRTSAAGSDILMPPGSYIISCIWAWGCQHHHGHLDSRVMGTLYHMLISRSNAPHVTYGVTFGG